jgi:hypothetical protein
LLPIAVPAGKNEDRSPSAVQIHQDAAIYTSLLPPGQSLTYSLAPGRRAYIFVIDGNLKLNGTALAPGDQARVSGEQKLQLSANPAQELRQPISCFSICRERAKICQLESLTPPPRQLRTDHVCSSKKSAKCFNTAPGELSTSLAADAYEIIILGKINEHCEAELKHRIKGPECHPPWVS